MTTKYELYVCLPAHLKSMGMPITTTLCIREMYEGDPIANHTYYGLGEGISKKILMHILRARMMGWEK